MDILKATIAKRKENELIIKKIKEKSKRNYITRGEIEKELLNNTNQIENNNNNNNNNNKDKPNDKGHDEMNLEKSVTQKNDLSNQENKTIKKLIPIDEIKRRLRSFNQPITLFGESDIERQERLDKVQHESIINMENIEKTNDYISKNNINKDSNHLHLNLQDNMMKRKISEISNHMTYNNNSNNDNNRNENNKNIINDELYVYSFFKKMISLWEKDLINRPESVKQSAQGKLATKTMKQCKDYIRPLFKLLKKHEVPIDILPHLKDIVVYCENNEYVRANDSYIKLAIGNAAWPIGVTMVGIHERTGREKINSNKQAHVMNNESQRKYLTSVKRLISYSQSISKAEPSKKVL